MNPKLPSSHDMQQTSSEPASLLEHVRFLQQEKRHKEALQVLQQAQPVTPDNADLWQLTGISLAAQNADTAAASAWRKCLEIDPQRQSVRESLAHTLFMLGNIEEALATYQQLLQGGWHNRRILIRYGAALGIKNQTKKALAVLDEALELQADDAEALSEKACILGSCGRFNEAEDLYRKALQHEPDRLEALLQLAMMQKVSISDPLITTLVERLESGYQLNTEARIFAHFILGKVHEAAADYAQAFAHFHQANRLMRQTLQYSSAEVRAYIESCEQNFTDERMGCTSSVPQRQFSPLFVIGMPRSGTSLMERILGAHPEVHPGGELVLIHQSLQEMLGEEALTDLPSTCSNLEPDQLDRLAESVMAKMQAMDPSAQMVTDKLPHNFMILGLIHQLFPQAPIIHMERNPLDTCLSCYTTLFSLGQDFSYDLAELGTFYRLYRRLMDYWRHVLPVGRMLEIRYEDLVQHPREVTHRMLEYCRLDWDESCLEPGNNNQPVHTASVYQVRQPIYRGSIDRWQQYAPYISPLREALGDVLQSG